MYSTPAPSYALPDYALADSPAGYPAPAPRAGALLTTQRVLACIALMLAIPTLAAMLFGVALFGTVLLAAASNMPST